MKKKGKKNKTRKIKKKKLPKILKKQVASQKSTSTEEKVVIKKIKKPIIPYKIKENLILIILNA